MPKLTIDGQEIEVGHGSTLLEAARELGIAIPTLCYHQALAPYGSCRVCLVESKLVTSCTYPAEDELIVHTESEKIDKARRVVVGLLLARAPEAEAVKDLAEEHGVTAGAADKLAAYLFDRASESTPTNCILCGLCVRVCA